MKEVFAHTLGGFLNAAQVSRGSLDELQLGLGRRQFRDRLLDVSIGHLVGVELGAVAGQVEDFDLGRVGLKPSLHGAAVMHPQVVHDQEDLLLRVPDEPLQEVDEDARVKRAVEDLPAHLALVGHAGDDRQAVALVGHAHQRCFALGRKAPATHVVAAQPALVAPVNVGPFELGALGNDGVGRVKPRLHRRRRLLVGLLHRLLRREAPALEVLAHGAHLQPHAAAGFDQLRHRTPCPQRVAELQLVRRLVRDEALHEGLLLGAQESLLAEFAPADAVDERFGTALVVALADVKHARAAKPGLLGNLLIRERSFAQTDHLHAPLVTRFARQASHVGCLHHHHMMAHLAFSRAQWPDQYASRGLLCGFRF
jgi:hypothetical protein